MISSHESDADTIADLELAVEFWRTMHTRACLLKAALVGEITDLRDDMARRAATAFVSDGWPPLVTTSTVAADLTRILEQEATR